MSGWGLAEGPSSQHNGSSHHGQPLYQQYAPTPDDADLSGRASEAASTPFGGSEAQLLADPEDVSPQRAGSGRWHG